MKFIPVIFGGYVNAYSLARIFNETYGIKSIICDVRGNNAAFSRICRFIVMENPNTNETKFIETAARIGKEIRDKGAVPLLLAAGDNYLIPLSKHKEILELIYLYSFSGWEVIEKLVHKNRLYELSGSLNIPCPKTMCVNSPVEDFRHLTPPLLVKPSDVNEFIYTFPGKKKNRVFNNYDETRFYVMMIYSGNYQSELIIQEYIPGGAENLFTCTTYSDTSGKIRTVSTGHKLSQHPPEAGTITSGITGYNKDIINLTKIILEHCYYFGIANTEFKYDKRNNTYRLMEVNARPGMWNYSTLLSGVNIIQSLVNDAVYKKSLPYTEGHTAFLWSIVSKGEMIKQTTGTENQSMVFDLIKKGNFFNPLDNKIENIIFKFMEKYRLSLFRKLCVKLYKKIVHQR